MFTSSSPPAGIEPRSAGQSEITALRLRFQGATSVALLHFEGNRCYEPPDIGHVVGVTEVPEIST
jgi:hypothetical protein